MIKVVGMSAKSKAEGLLGTVMDKTKLNSKTSSTTCASNTTKKPSESKVTVNEQGGSDMTAIPEQKEPGSNKEDTVQANDELSMDNLLGGDGNSAENDEADDLFNYNYDNDGDCDGDSGEVSKTRSDSKKQLIGDGDDSGAKKNGIV